MRKIYCDECKRETEKDEILDGSLEYQCGIYKVSIYYPFLDKDICMGCACIKGREIISTLANEYKKIDGGENEFNSKQKTHGIPYTIGEARKVAATHMMDMYHRELILWLCDELESYNIDRKCKE